MYKRNAGLYAKNERVTSNYHQCKYESEVHVNPALRLFLTVGKHSY